MELPAGVDETFDALVFDWVGTAVAHLRADATAIRRRIESLCGAGVHVFVVSRDDAGEVDAQLRVRPSGRGSLHLCGGSGSEVVEVTRHGLVPVSRRQATAAEDRALDRAAARAVDELRGRGVDARLVPDRSSGRTIDLAPGGRLADPGGAGVAAPPHEVSERCPPAGTGTIGDVVALAGEAARAAGLGSARVTSDGQHLSIGLTDKSDSARFAAAWLAGRGVTGQLVLVAGDELGAAGGVPGSDSPMVVDELARARFVSVGREPGGVPEGVLHLGGGPARFLELLDAQIERRAAHRVPQVDADPAWVVTLPGDPARERVAEALGALPNGWAGTRGSREDPGPASLPLFAVAGAYEDDGHLLHGPAWTSLTTRPAPARHVTRLLDLRTGTLARLDPTGALRSIRFVSASARHTMALRAEGQLEPPLAGSDPALAGVDERDGAATSVAHAGLGRTRIAVATRDRWESRGDRAAVERLAAWAAGSPAQDTGRRAAARLAGASALGFDALLADHRAAWAARWLDADVAIEGGPGADEDQLAARFAVFHLLAAAAETGEAAVGARGLTGDAYGGHVFWDADVFVLPALAAIRPDAARAMLEYRVRRLPAARAEAAARGLAGARFPWESARDGRDVTPRLLHGAHGEPIPILTGMHEEHIVADVAWAADRYAAWTGDDAFLPEGPGRDLAVETARYWASRIRVDRSGRGHLYGVMGPDEYHEVVDDNAFTNVMARWNLTRGAELLGSSGRAADAEEAARWRELATGLVDGWDPERRLYEQFAGYFGLQPMLVAQVARPPVAIDVLLGHDRVARSQLIKQADVLMLHHLLPTAVVPGSLEPCIDFYEPRTAHGSSLSPAISASLLARAGRAEAALDLYRVAARLDLDDLTGTTAGGLHLATMGGLWQALAHGFLGIRAVADGLSVDPHLPGDWSALSMRFRFRGQRVRVRATHHEVVVTFGEPMRLRVAGGDVEEHQPPRLTVPLSDPTPTGRSRP